MIKLKPYSLSELADIYEVCVRTIKRWLLPHQHRIGERQGRYYTVKQVKIIFEQLGMPQDYML
ncbi:hypothetical protein ACTJIJ_21840 [Niabella sp. 22666]|uniref:hypothetical protein n=1 Tax=Niabella sp. 22666 TaxID=3453954 RepID=UPI003F8508D6